MTRGGKRRHHPRGRHARFSAELETYGVALLTAKSGDETAVMHASCALYVSAHGLPFTHAGTSLPEGVERGVPLKCFANAQQAARTHGLGYAEGFAGPTAAGRWTLHAWNLNDGKVVDPTWENDPGPRGHYFGIAFQSSDLPEGEESGICLLSDLIGGKVIDFDRTTGRVRLHDLTHYNDLSGLVPSEPGHIRRIS